MPTTTVCVCVSVCAHMHVGVKEWFDRCQTTEADILISTPPKSSHHAYEVWWKQLHNLEKRNILEISCMTVHKQNVYLAPQLSHPVPLIHCENGCGNPSSFVCYFTLFKTLLLQWLSNHDWQQIRSNRNVNTNSPHREANKIMQNSTILTMQNKIHTSATLYITNIWLTCGNIL